MKRSYHMLKLLLLALTVAVTSHTAMAQQTKRYVKPNGTGDGSSWATPSGSLQTMVDASASGDTVFVAIGTYTGGFYMKEGVQVYGGFKGDDTETSTSQLPPAVGGTGGAILDGGGTQRVLTQPKAFTAPTVWYGFTLRHGNATPGVGSLVSDSAGTAVAGVLYQYDPATGAELMVNLGEKNYIKWYSSATGITALPNITDETTAKADFSGAGNTAAITKQLGVGDYAAYWCDTLTAGNYRNWYLPALGELFALYGKKDTVNASINRIGATTLSDNIYWSSTEYNDHTAWFVYFGHGNVYNGIKNYIYDARAVRAFNLFNNFNNWACSGGGALLQGGGILRNCLVDSCSALGIGGGVYAAPGAQLQGCLVAANTATGNPGVYANGATIVNSTVAANRQTKAPVPVLPQVGDIYYTDGSYSPGTAAPLTGKTVMGIVCTVNADNPRTGLVMNITEPSPAANNWQTQMNWAAGLTIGGYGWRLPAVGELQALYNNRGILNTALTNVAGTTLSANWYWSSSPVKASNLVGNVWFVSFFYGAVSYDVKSSSGVFARAVHAF